MQERVRGPAAGVVCFADDRQLREGFKKEPGGLWLRTLDAPDLIPAGSCVMYVGRSISFPVQSMMVRG